ncbi:Basic helix-loop-helix transcription factor [Trema orientale]|uniref:Basic helix-loop-helix transcription factor n=1 Tax=Trema orientale TaxID=63057 RepID=A0A2P5EM79_TREOI|nr:Basic helix-loop-helix transcription factor [Trema orientale]
MENLYPQYSSPHPKGDDFSQHNKASVLRNDESFLVPYWHLPPPTSASAAFQFRGFPSNIPIDGFTAEEDKAAAASKSHSQAEKRRRDRINAQLATLRKLIPKSDKMDKAALLGSVIDHVKDLKRKAGEVGKSSVVPTEVDEIIIDSNLSDQDYIRLTEVGAEKNTRDKVNYIKASVCCDDRPELFSELIQVLKGLRLTAVRADVSSIGGRIKSVLILSSKNSEDGNTSVCINNLKQSLKLVLSKIASSSSMASNCRIRSKRQRFFLPSSHVSQ